MSKVFVTSDTHFCHNREFLYGPRGFDNPWDMNESIVAKWNEVVRPEDDVFHLGDVMLNDNEEGGRLLRRLNGLIHIILGNHDTLERIKIFESCPNVVEITYAKPIRYRGLHFFLTHYPTITSVHDYDKPLRSRTLNLCGHSHTPDRFADWSKGFIYHVELDAHNCTPVFMDDIVEDLTNKV